YPESLHVTMAGEIAAMTLVGGMRSFVGPAVGAAVFVFMRDTLSSWTENWLVYFGVIFIAFVMFSPNGIVGVVQRLRGLRRGVSRSFQIISVFQSLSVFENVRLAVQAKHPRRFAMLTDSTRLTDAAAEAARLLQAVGLAEHAGTLAANLSHGDQRLLEIAIALATRPKLLLLDEPLAGLSAPDRVRVAALIRALHGSVTIVLIDHDIDQVLALSDRITVLHQGRVIAEGAPAEIQKNAEVQTAYLGHLKVAAGAGAGLARAEGAPLLAVVSVDAFYGKSHVL